MARPLRVLFINDTARNGGPGRSLHSILKFLDPAIIHRAVVLPRPGPVSELLVRDRVVDELRFEPNLVENPIEPWGRAMERRDFEAPPLQKALRLGGNVVKAALALASLAKIVREGRIDLIYCNGTNADFAGAAVAMNTHVPALWHVRYTSLPKAVRGLHRALSASPSIRRILCVSRASAALFPHCHEKVRVVHNALDAADFDPELVRPDLRRELGLEGGVVLFGSHGRVLRRKGYVEMIRAARIAEDRLSQPSAGAGPLPVYVVVGDTPNDFRPDHVEQCRSLARELGLGDRFHMLGFREDVRPLVSDFDVAVVPSVYPDPLPRAVIESMALAKPVVAFDVGGVSEMLDNGVTGELVAFEPTGRGDEGASDRSIERLADSLVRYAQDPGLRDRQGRAARQRILRDFDARARAKTIEGEIASACAASLEPR